jgi:hypothetical protein
MNGKKKKCTDQYIQATIHRYLKWIKIQSKIKPELRKIKVPRGRSSRTYPLKFNSHEAPWGAPSWPLWALNRSQNQNTEILTTPMQISMKNESFTYGDKADRATWCATTQTDIRHGLFIPLGHNEFKTQQQNHHQNSTTLFPKFTDLND